MVKFLKFFSCLLIVFFLVLELVLRTFGLVSDSPRRALINNDFLYLPGQSGNYLKGARGEIHGVYKINSTGWNSVIEYTPKFNIIQYAIIGDSYIEGFEIDNRKSIGRKVEQLNPNVEIHEYGISGADLPDFYEMYIKYCKNKYSRTFVLLCDKDFLNNNTTAINRPENNFSYSFSRKIYETIGFFRYFNMQIRIRDNFVSNEPPKNFGYEQGMPYLKKLLLDPSVYFLYEEGHLNPQFVKLLGVRGIIINHHIKPFDFGFDKHWNENGRENVAVAISNNIR
jgi:hypothetical protein